MINDERMEFNLMFKDNKNMCGRWVLMSSLITFDKFAFQIVA